MIKYKMDIGCRIKDNKRDLNIIDREYRPKQKINPKSGNMFTSNEKWYKYYCNKCGYENWIIGKSLIYNCCGCSSCCTSTKSINIGVNDVGTTHPWIQKYLKDKDDMYKYSFGSEKFVNVICPDCGRGKEIQICYLCRFNSIACSCSDKISYPEKFVFNVLDQIGVKFIYQLSKRDFDWCDKYLYDFYIPSLNIILETHGLQHYKENKNFKMSLKDVVNNDDIKINIAKSNNISKYIIIDCRYSDSNYISNNILSSELSKIFDLSIIDWNKADKFGLSNFVKTACDYKKNNPNITTTEIGCLMNLTKPTIRKYLKKGMKHGWCEYDANNELHSVLKSNARKVGKQQEKLINIYKNGVLLGTYESATKLSKVSKEVFGKELNISKICAVARGDRNHHHGFTFKYVDITKDKVD